MLYRKEVILCYLNLITNYSAGFQLIVSPSQRFFKIMVTVI
nr:MAG TPA: hypothetical protein [Caudoviricetes sp.]